MTAILYDLLYAIPLSLIAVFEGRPYFVSPEKGFPVLFITLATLGACTAMRHWENRLKYGIPGVIAALGAGIVLIQGPEQRGEFLYEKQWLLWTALATIGCYVAGCLLARIRLLRRLTAVGLLIVLLLLTFFWVWPEKITVAASVTVMALVIADELQRAWEKSGYVDAKGHLVSVSPFIAGLCFLVFLLPAPEQPYDWSFAVRIWNRAAEYVKVTSRWFHGGDEDYGGVIDFTDDGTILGRLSKKEKEVLVLSGSREVGSTVYLAGKVMDTFDGRKWSASYEEENRDRMLDALETVSAVKKYDPEYVTNYVWRVNLKATYKEFNTKYFFAPQKAILNKDQLGNEKFVQRGGDLIADKNLGYGTEYALQYVRMNVRHEGFLKFLSEAEEPDPETWEAVRYQYESRDEDGREKEGSSYEDYLRYRERIYRYYLPETTISEKAKAYLDRVFEGADSDLEKLSRLELLLASYQYDLEPGKLPDEVQTPADFLDYFLLESQDGYCVHFATAFILVARNLGFPARYVQGFYVQKDWNTEVVVSSTMAHAWPEVYLKGIGWIAFEPTPGKMSMDTWEFKKNEEISYSDEGSDSWRPTDAMIDPDELGEDEPEERFTIPWKVILIPLGLVVVFLLLFLLIDRMLILAWQKKLTDAGRFRLALKKNWRVLALLGYSASEGETMEEFAARVGKELPETCLTFLGDQELVAYAGELPTAGMRERAEEDLGELMALLKEEKGKWFFWYRYQIFRMEAGKKLN